MDTASILKDLGFDGNIRVLEGVASALDVIRVAGGQVNPASIWQDIKDDPDLIGNYYHLKFKGRGARPTPVITAKGLDILLNLIPGERVKKFRIKAVETFRRILGGDRTLIAEIEKNFNIAEKDNVSAQAFFGRTLTRTDQKDLKSYDKTNYIYVRGFDEIFASAENSFCTINGDKTPPKLNLNLIKFGITQSLDKRNDGYGDDNGFYHYAINLSKGSDAAHVESILRARFKKLAIGYKHEYVDSKGLYAYFNPDSKIEHSLDYEQYKQLMLDLFAYIITETHKMYPQTLLMSEPYGRKYSNIFEEIDDDANTHSVCKKSSGIISSALKEEDLPAYGAIFPENNVLAIYSAPVLIEKEKTQQAIQDRLKVEAEETTKQAEEKTKQLALQLQILQLEQNIKVGSKNISGPLANCEERACAGPDLLKKHITDFVSERCTIKAGLREHSVNLRWSFENYRRMYNQSGGWVRLKSYMVSLGCAPIKSSFVDSRRPQKRTKGWVGIQLTPAAFSNCLMP